MAALRVFVATLAFTGIEIPLGGRASVSGRLVFDGATPAPDFGQVSLSFGPRDGAADCRSHDRPEIRADWMFTVPDIWGSCVVRAAAGAWRLKAVVHNGVNLLDRPIEFKPGVQLRDVQVVFTDRLTTLSFEVTDERRVPTQEFVAIVFPVDRERWGEQGGVVRTHVPAAAFEGAPVRRPMPGATGPSAPARPPTQRPAISGLQPASYFVVAVEDAASEDLQDPGYLERLSTLAERVSLGEGEALDSTPPSTCASDRAAIARRSSGCQGATTRSVGK